MITLYRHELSGHSHRVELFLNLLDLDFERVDVDLMAGEHKNPEFLALNPFGQVPVLVDQVGVDQVGVDQVGVDQVGVDDRVITDSNAILVYLAERHAPLGEWLGDGSVGRARVQRWLSVAAGEIAAGPAAARLVTVFGAAIDHDRAKSIAESVLAQLDTALDDHDFVAGRAPTIADVALYAYVAHAPEGEVSLSPYPHVRAWVARIEALPRFVPMTRTPVGLAA